MISKDREALREIYRKTEDKGVSHFIPAKEKADIYSKDHIFSVCAYCRVSTENDEQLSSYELQKQHYETVAQNHPNWNFKHIFADEGISGTSLKNRDEFKAMIEACRRGEYDLIVTKSVSRFARNLVDCVSYVRELKNLPKPVGVFFETDGLSTLSEESELKLSMLATFAQEESSKKSEAMNWSLKERFKNKKLLTPELFGYRRPRDAGGHYIKYGTLEIEESEAEVVRFIFNSFLAGYTPEGIAKILTEIGVKTKMGNTNWHEGSIGYILRNERYCGSVLTWKTFTANIFEHKKKKNNQDKDQYLYEDDHPAIITQEQFEAAQTLLLNRKNGMRGGYHLMQVIDSGVFQGYVPINHRWTNDDPDEYYKASNSVQTVNQPLRYRKNYFSAFDLSGYQVVRGSFLTSRTELPCINITNDKISFNSSCSRCFSNVEFIQLLLHPTDRKIAIRPCNRIDSFSISWRYNSEDPYTSKNINCPYFSAALYQIMDWNPDYTYRIIGTWIERGNDRIIIFNLSNAMPAVLIEEQEDDETIKAKRVPVCPEEWQDTFGNEFYRFSLENNLYYDNKKDGLRSDESGKVVEGQIGFQICSGGELKQQVEEIKIKLGENNG